MKIIATLILFFSIGTTVYAIDFKSGIIEMQRVTGLSGLTTGATLHRDVARLHQSRKSLIKKVLTFTSRRDRAKLA
jgi:hypothetical protein